MNVSTLLSALSRHFRRRRMARFVREMRITSRTRVLDIGGTPENWALLAVQPRLTLLNTPRAAAEMGPHTWVAGDGCALPFRDGAFDVVFSNSVIEHVGGEAAQRAFAREVVRVGRAYWVQTPDRRFPVEQHLLTPFVHWLPRHWQRRLAPRLNWWRWLVPVTRDRRNFFIKHYMDDIHLLGVCELQSHFPGSRVVRERVLFLPKSLIVLGIGKS